MSAVRLDYAGALFGGAIALIAAFRERRSVAVWFFVAGMALLFLIRIFIYLGEAGSTSLEQVAPQPKTKLASQISTKDPNYLNVHKMTVRWKDFKESSYTLLANYNMFDPKQVMDAEKIEQRANLIFQSAEAAYNQRNLPQALKLLDDVLTRMPSHARAQKLKLDIQNSLDKPAETPPPAASRRGARGTPIAPRQ